MARKTSALARQACTVLWVRPESAAFTRREHSFQVAAGCRICLKATAMVLDLHPIGSSRAPSLCLCTGRNASGQVALPWVVAKRAPRRHRLRTPAFMRERGAECRKRIPIRTDRLR